MRKKVTSIVLLVLVASMIIGSIPNHVYADSQSDSLIRIATQARDQLRIHLSKVDTSQEIKEKFELGSTEIESLIKALKDENIPAAREHFLSAMKIFNEIIQQISERTSTSETTLSASQPAEAPTISNEIDRSERYIDQLKGISDKNGFEIDFSHVYELIDIARNQLGEGNSEAANSTIEKIKRSISELNETLREKTRHYTTDRAKTLAEKYLEDLDILIAEAEEIGASQETLAKLVEIKEHLNSASDSSDVEQIINELRHLISVKQDFEDTKIERLKSRVNQLESKIVQLSNYPYKIPELGKAKDMFSDLTDLISEGSYNEALRVLNSLNDLINEIEYSISQRNEEITANKEDSSSSLADSKTERIKIKIQRLETAINKLAEEVGENAAAKRWLDNALSLLENARKHVDDSPDESLKIITSIEQIIKRIQNTIQ
jgi:outer membrane murein-binding lipoprotein Lpp